MASYTKAAQQWATFAKAWYLLDAKMQPPGKIAAATVLRLEGRHKPIYHALNDCGDHVVIINTRHIAFSGNKWEQKVYSSHTGYPGGFKQVTATQLHLKDPTALEKSEHIHQSEVSSTRTDQLFYRTGSFQQVSVPHAAEEDQKPDMNTERLLNVVPEFFSMEEDDWKKIVKLTVYRMLPKNLLRRTLMQRLHLFPEDVIPEDIQKNLLQEIPQPREVPKRLDEYTPEEIAAFPRVWTPPKDFRWK